MNIKEKIYLVWGLISVIPFVLMVPLAVVHGVNANYGLDVNFNNYAIPFIIALSWFAYTVVMVVPKELKNNAKCL